MVATTKQVTESTPAVTPSQPTPGPSNPGTIRFLWCVRMQPHTDCSIEGEQEEHVVDEFKGFEYKCTNGCIKVFTVSISKYEIT